MDTEKQRLLLWCLSHAESLRIVSREQYSIFVLLCAIFVVIVVLFICFVFCFGCLGTPLILPLFATGGSFVFAQHKIDIFDRV